MGVWKQKKRRLGTLRCPSRKARHFTFAPRWERGATHRRMECVRIQTENIRELTVKGLEPELKSLMEKHHSNLMQMCTGHEISGRALRTELHGKLSTRQSTLWEAAREKILARELEENMRVGESGAEMETDARDRYAVAVRERANESSQLRAELEEQRYSDALRCQHGDLLALNNKHINATSARLAHDRNIVMRLLSHGRSVVGEARLSDQTTWSSYITAQCNAFVEATILETTADFERQRDMTIDATIHQVQRSALAWERDRTQAVDAECMRQRSIHLVAVAALRTERTEWVNRHLTALQNAQIMREELTRLRVNESRKRQDRTEAEIRTEGPRLQGKDHAHVLASKYLVHKSAQASILDDLHHSHVAADAAAVTVTARLEQASDAQNRAKLRLAKQHQSALAAKDEEVKSQFQAIAGEILEIEDVLDVEHVRHSHLGYLATTYRG